ncbi:transposase [Streptomyces sp. NPDC048680]|uniref:transposase n=1 Tax=Streptomyces sp. NPDC048680 TaxID=3155492 RepID=UPI003443B52A
MRDRLDGLWCDEDFADWYPRDRRPGLSPAQLATVCVLQFLLGLSDRQATEAVNCRIDSEYSMAMELDDPGSTTRCWPTSAIAWPKTTAPTVFSTPLTCSTSCSVRTGGSVTADRSAWARTPPSPGPESSPPEATPSDSWNTSTSTEQTTRPARASGDC